MITFITIGERKRNTTRHQQEKTLKRKTPSSDSDSDSSKDEDSDDEYLNKSKFCLHVISMLFWTNGVVLQYETDGKTFPRFVHWFGTNTLEEAFGVVEEKKCLSLSQLSHEKKMRLKDKICRKKYGRLNYQLMLDAMEKPENERLPFPKLPEDYELVLGPKADRYLFELEAEP